MPHNLDLILTLTGGLAAALFFGFITQKLRLSPIVGYLLAGVALSTHTPGFVADIRLAEQLAEIGVILLLFGVGLHFHLRDLLAVRKVAVPGAIVQSAVATLLGMLVTRAAGWSLEAGLVFGLAISVASTVVLLRVLADHDALHTRTGHIAVGWLIVEDLFTVVSLVVLPALAMATRSEGAAGGTGALLASLGISLLKVGALVAITLVVGQRVIPHLFAFVARTRSRELFTLTVLVVALGIAVGSATIFGVSMALGAFLAGMVVGQSEFSTRAASEALPMRDAFAVLFFVSMGMLFDPLGVMPNLGLILVTLAIVVIGKPLAAYLVMIVLRHPPATALRVAVALAQIGEFSFILAALGRQLGILPEAATQALVATSIVSITLNPLLYKASGPVARWLTRVAPAASAADELETSSVDPALRTIVVGYGPVGRSLAHQLREIGFDVTVIELNHDTVREQRAKGVRALYGDASQQEVLEQAGIHQATTIVFAASGDAVAVVRLAKQLNPAILAIARTTYVGETRALAEAGAYVVAAETEVALAMSEKILEYLGASPEQVDRARDRVRDELREAARHTRPASASV